MAGMCRDCGLVDIDAKMETDRVFTVIGKIDLERRRNWEIQWSGARIRTAELLGSEALADAFIEKFIAYQDRLHTLYRQRAEAILTTAARFETPRAVFISRSSRH
jgi:hypothetical protein